MRGRAASRCTAAGEGLAPWEPPLLLLSPPPPPPLHARGSLWLVPLFDLPRGGNEKHFFGCSTTQQLLARCSGSTERRGGGELLLALSAAGLGLAGGQLGTGGRGGSAPPPCPPPLSRWKMEAKALFNMQKALVQPFQMCMLDIPLSVQEDYEVSGGGGGWQ